MTTLSWCAWVHIANWACETRRGQNAAQLSTKGCILSRVPLILNHKWFKRFKRFITFKVGLSSLWRKSENIGKEGAGSPRTDVWYMVRRRASDAGIETAIGCHTFCATGITDYLTNGGRIEVAQRMAGHSNAKTTGLYDRRNDDISVGEVEKIGI